MSPTADPAPGRARQGRRRSGGPARAVLVGAGAAMLLALPLGCGSEPPTPAERLDELRRTLARKVPAGWQVGYARDAGFRLRAEVAGGDLVLWRTEKAGLVSRPPEIVPEENPGTLHFAVSPRPFIPRDEYAERWAANEAIRKEHERVMHRVAMVPRDENGELMPRGTVEELDVARFSREYAALPAYDKNMPTHYYRDLALRLRDYRTSLLPKERELQQEMNTVWVVLMSAVEAYGR